MLALAIAATSVVICILIVIRKAKGKPVSF